MHGTINAAGEGPDRSDDAAAPDYSLPASVIKVIAVGLVLAIIAAFVARTTDIGATRLVPAPAVETRELKFVTRPDGQLSIMDVQRNTEIRKLSAKSDGFIKIVLRALELERKVAAVALDAPVRLSSLTDGQLILEDPSTGRIITLSAFGPGNRAAFAELLEARSE
ncbi:MAG: photosynthetic complex assembly protein PuhC [Hyphomicrobium sp.]